ETLQRLFKPAELAQDIAMKHPGGRICRIAFQRPLYEHGGFRGIALPRGDQSQQMQRRRVIRLRRQYLLAELPRARHVAIVVAVCSLVEELSDVGHVCEKSAVSLPVLPVAYTVSGAGAQPISRTSAATSSAAGRVRASGA